MHLARFAVAAVTIALGCVVAGGGCGLGVLDVPPGASVEPNSDASPSTRGDSGDLVPEPGATDDAGDGGLVDAGPDAPMQDGGPCPNECSSCVGGICQIDCPGPKCNGAMNCAIGRACRIVCNGSGACANMTVSCPVGNPCYVHCEKADACKNITLNATAASTLCVQCMGPSSCGAFTCNLPATSCARACANVGPDKACDELNQCGNCAAVDDCP